MPKPCRTACLLITLFVALAPGRGVLAADSDEISELKRAIEALRAENRALAQRLSVIEDGRPGTAPPVWGQRIDQRVKELETGKTAQEDAVRAIIRDSVSTLGSKINESVSMGGVVDFSVSRNREFSGTRETKLGLGGPDFEFEIQVSDWVLGQVKLESINGRDTPLATADGRTTTIDRLAVDTAFLTLGDAQRFPATLSAGRMVLPFGISTGRPVADVLSTASPLTVEVFELRANALALNLAWPTPPLAPPLPPVVAPPVQPLVLRPLLNALGLRLGYAPVAGRLKPLAATPPLPAFAPFTAGLLVYEGVTAGGLRQHHGASLGYQARGHCGKSYDQLTTSNLCPWALNIDLNYNSAIFNSRFLASEYAPVLNQIGRVPGMAASVKAAVGPFALVGEWNSASRHARFVDDAGRQQDIQPSAWQMSLGWQADWNPWVQEIGAQGSYLAIGYSQSRGLAGWARAADSGAERVGFMPKRRLLLTAGEWVTDGLRVAVEWSRQWDYPSAEGGSGKSWTGITTTLTYVW